jgi:hypothetical protein
MAHYESVVTDYLRADRALFLNTECCIQLNPGDNPDTSGPHWYCDAIAVDFRARQILLCEISYESKLAALTKRLKGWNDNWALLCIALRRDSHLPADWTDVRPWLFVPEAQIPLLRQRLVQIGTERPLNFEPRITALEMVQPWRYRSWNRVDEQLAPT